MDSSLPRRIPPTAIEQTIYDEIRNANRRASLQQAWMRRVIPVAATWNDNVHYDSRKGQSGRTD